MNDLWKTAEKMRQRASEAVGRAKRERIQAQEREEDRKFESRLRFESAKIWTWERGIREPRSLMGSSWPAFEAQARKFGIGSPNQIRRFKIPRKEVTS